MSPRRTLLPLAAAAALLAACGGSPTPTSQPVAPAATEAPAVAASPTLAPLDLGDEADGPLAPPGLGTNPGSLIDGAPAPEGAAAGGDVAFNEGVDREFVDPVSAETAENLAYFKGRWMINGGYLEQSQGARRSSVSFRRYNGKGFGTNAGSAPAHYRADVTVWVYQPSSQYPDMVGAPLGILGYAPYYVDETHYLLVVAKPKAVEVWAVDGQAPATAWPMKNLLFTAPLDTTLDVGTPVAWSTEINTLENIAYIWLNGKKLATVRHPLIRDRGIQHVALLSNGNFLHFQGFKVYAF